MESLLTEVIVGRIEYCKSLEELKKEILSTLQEQKFVWSLECDKLISHSGVTENEVAASMGISRQSLSAWRNQGGNIKRENLKKLGMAVGYEIAQINTLLKKYGHYWELYSKNEEDAVCMFVVNQHYGAEAVKKYEYILDRMNSNIQQSQCGEICDETTEKFSEKLSTVQDEDELEQFIREHSNIYATAYRKFFASINSFITINKARIKSINYLNDNQGWRSGFKLAVDRAMRAEKVPKREQIIALALSLDCSQEKLDEWLKLAHMEPLYVKNPFDAVIKYIINKETDTRMVKGKEVEYIRDTPEADEEFTERFEYAIYILNELSDPKMPTIPEISEIKRAFDYDSEKE